MAFLPPKVITDAWKNWSSLPLEEQERINNLSEKLTISLKKDNDPGFFSAALFVGLFFWN